MRASLQRHGKPSLTCDLPLSYWPVSRRTVLMGDGGMTFGAAGCSSVPRTTYDAVRTERAGADLMRLPRISRALITAVTLAALAALGTVATVLGVSTGGGFPG
jgi:hypothetical protein